MSRKKHKGHSAEDTFDTFSTRHPKSGAHKLEKVTPRDGFKWIAICHESKKATLHHTRDEAREGYKQIKPQDQQAA